MADTQCGSERDFVWRGDGECGGKDSRAFDYDWRECSGWGGAVG